jgi:hypothetical protein
MQQCFINAIQKLGKAKGRQAQGKRRGERPGTTRCPPNAVLAGPAQQQRLCHQRVDCLFATVAKPRKGAAVGQAGDALAKIRHLRAESQINRTKSASPLAPAGAVRPTLAAPGFFHYPQEGIDYPPGFL